MYAPTLTDSDLARFWAKVQATDDCWLWTGASSGYPGNQYGVLKLNGRNHKAHRLSYVMHYGPTDLFVCHTCDNGLCVRPDHLFAGTQSANMQDAFKKGRNRGPGPISLAARARGERHGLALLTEVEVIEIRQRYAGGETVAALARAFGLSWPTIDKVVKRISWRHV